MAPGFFLTVHVDTRSCTTVFFALFTAPCTWQDAFGARLSRLASSLRHCPVSYTHLTLPTICSV
eukprot:5309440-Prorocentrum_lima.AAC.1